MWPNTSDGKNSNKEWVLPAAVNRRTISVCPLWHAMYNGVTPAPICLLISASYLCAKYKINPHDRSLMRMRYSAAECRQSIPALISLATTVSCPRLIATNSGLSPFLFDLRTSAPKIQSSWTCGLNQCNTISTKQCRLQQHTWTLFTSDWKWKIIFLQISQTPFTDLIPVVDN